ncbi:MAG TPA: carboxypeptidase-like regulatory domain-containing protein [Terriglobales bacterium]|nr:carboxypeptidase-like regulatory domain-containing protein [Terriglobales bacterium]
MKIVTILGLLAGMLAGFPRSARAQDGYQVISMTDGGTITGTVKWVGPQPHLTTLPITKDPQICDPESAKKRDLERLIIGPDGGVANTVVYLKDVSRGKPFDLPEPRRFLDQKHCRYEPHILLVPKNALLQMKSSDATLHTIHMDGAATYNLPFPFPDQVVSREMKTAGVVNLKCNGGHVWMNAEMFIAPHPYYTVTDESGKFELTNVPPGQYEIIAWHEGWSVDREESMFDVLTEKRVQRPIFSDPRIIEKKITVNRNETAVASFVLDK